MICVVESRERWRVVEKREWKRERGRREGGDAWHVQRINRINRIYRYTDIQRTEERVVHTERVRSSE